MAEMRNESQLPVLGRLTWMAVGPAILLLSAVQIWKSPKAGWLTIADVVFWLAFLGMLAGRWIEHQRGNAKTGTGEPATDRDFYRYCIVAALLVVAVWIVAKLVSNYMF